MRIALVGTGAASLMSTLTSLGAPSYLPPKIGVAMLHLLASPSLATPPGRALSIVPQP